MNFAIVVTSDHAGFELKSQLLAYFSSEGIEFVDIGTKGPEAVDYPDFGHKLGSLIENGEYTMGISICGSGNGINMTTNKHKGVRGVLCWNEEISEMARKHNDANVCSLPARYIDVETAKKIVNAFLNTSFEGGRHERRKKKIDISIN